MNEIMSELLKGVGTVAIGILTGAAVKAIKRWSAKHDNDLLGDVAAMVVRSIEQWATKEMQPGEKKPTNPTKLSFAAAQVAERLPWVSTDTIESAIKTAVYDMNQARDRRPFIDP